MSQWSSRAAAAAAAEEERNENALLWVAPSCSLVFCSNEIGWGRIMMVCLGMCFLFFNILFSAPLAHCLRIKKIYMVYKNGENDENQREKSLHRSQSTFQFGFRLLFYCIYTIFNWKRPIYGGRSSKWIVTKALECHKWTHTLNNNHRGTKKKNIEP